MRWENKIFRICINATFWFFICDDWSLWSFKIWFYVSLQLTKNLRAICAKNILCSMFALEVFDVLLNGVNFATKAFNVLPFTLGLQCFKKSFRMFTEAWKLCGNRHALWNKRVFHLRVSSEQEGWPIFLIDGKSIRFTQRWFRCEGMETL